MPFIKISGLTTATVVSATNQFEINQNGASRSLEVSVLDSYIKGSSPLPVVVSVSSAAAAVRITQLGSGDAILVEDSANPDASPFVVRADGKVGIGSAAPVISLVVSATDAIRIPVGDTSARPSGAAGYLRFNSATNSFEGHNGTSWGSIGGGATGGGNDNIFYLNGQTVSASYSIPSGQNAGSFGPITIASGVTVEVPTSSVWTVV